MPTAESPINPALAAAGLPPRALLPEGHTAMSMSADVPTPPRELAGQLRPLPQLIFSSRWLQLPLYLGLIVAQGVYVVLFLKELWHLVLGAMKFTDNVISIHKSEITYTGIEA